MYGTTSELFLHVYRWKAFHLIVDYINKTVIISMIIVLKTFHNYVRNCTCVSSILNRLFNVFQNIFEYTIQLAINLFQYPWFPFLRTKIKILIRRFYFWGLQSSCWVEIHYLQTSVFWRICHILSTISWSSLKWFLFLSEMQRQLRSGKTS